MRDLIQYFQNVLHVVVTGNLTLYEHTTYVCTIERSIEERFANYHMSFFPFHLRRIIKANILLYFIIINHYYYYTIVHVLTQQIIQFTFYLLDYT